jgi:hypothetical protein
MSNLYCHPGRAGGTPFGVSGRAFTITPVLPLVDMFPTFSEAPRRIYMSATIADDSEIVRTFDTNAEAAENPFPRAHSLELVSG